MREEVTGEGVFGGERWGWLEGRCKRKRRRKGGKGVLKEGEKCLGACLSIGHLSFLGPSSNLFVSTGYGTGR